MSGKTNNSLTIVITKRSGGGIITKQTVHNKEYKLVGEKHPKNTFQARNSKYIKKFYRLKCQI